MSPILIATALHAIIAAIFISFCGVVRIWNFNRDCTGTCRLDVGHLGGVAHFRIPARKPNVDFLLLLLLRIPYCETLLLCCFLVAVLSLVV